jgi:hypothetical protein
MALGTRLVVFLILIINVSPEFTRTSLLGEIYILSRSRFFASVDFASVDFLRRSVWFGLVWFGLVWFGLVWFGLVWFGLVWLSVCLEYLIIYLALIPELISEQ